MISGTGLRSLGLGIRDLQATQVLSKIITVWHINSPYNFNTLSSRQVTRIEKIINKGIVPRGGGGGVLRYISDGDVRMRGNC